MFVAGAADWALDSTMGMVRPRTNANVRTARTGITSSLVHVGKEWLLRACSRLWYLQTILMRSVLNRRDPIDVATIEDTGRMLEVATSSVTEPAHPGRE